MTPEEIAAAEKAAAEKAEADAKAKVSPETQALLDRIAALETDNKEAQKRRDKALKDREELERKQLEADGKYKEALESVTPKLAKLDELEALVESFNAKEQKAFEARIAAVPATHKALVDSIKGLPLAQQVAMMDQWETAGIFKAVVLAPNMQNPGEKGTVASKKDLKDMKAKMDYIDIHGSKAYASLPD